MALLQGAPILWIRGFLPGAKAPKRTLHESSLVDDIISNTKNHFRIGEKHRLMDMCRLGAAAVGVAVEAIAATGGSIDVGKALHRIWMPVNPAAGSRRRTHQ